MKEIRIEKLTLNIGAGEAGAKLDKAVMLLEKLSESKPIITKSKKRIPTWGVRPGLTIGAKVTLRGKKAEEMLSRLLSAKESILSEKNFDKEGNFSFGIPEYIDIPNIDYIVEVGIIGLEAAVTLSRGGYRIKNRKYNKKSIPTKHRITKDEAINFAKSKYNVKIKEETE